LVPTLQTGDVVVLDNLAVHKRAKVQSLIEAAGCTLLFVPAYSPELNPLKRRLPNSRLCYSKPIRTVEGLQPFLCWCNSAFSPEERASFFSPCRYHATASPNPL
jgi:transposase